MGKSKSHSSGERVNKRRYRGSEQTESFDLQAELAKLGGDEEDEDDE